MKPAALPPVTLTCPKCSESWESRAKAGSTIRCPRNRRSRGRDCTGVAYVPKARPRRTEAAAVQLAADRAPGWDAEPPGVLDWRDQLGPECADAPSCNMCDCDGPPVRYTADHTGTVCPGCGAECWDTPPAARARGRANAKATATIARVGRTRAEQLDLDRAHRAFKRGKAAVLDAIARQLAVSRLTLDSITDLETYREEVTKAETPARVADLAAQLQQETFTRLPWWRDDTYTDDDDQDDGPELHDDDAAELPERPALRALPGGAWSDADYAAEAQRRITGQQRAAELRDWNRRNAY